jgi:hypothetical protein
MTHSRACLVICAVAGVGCSAPVVDDIADASGAMTEGVVVVERMVGGDGAAQTSVSAKFMRLSAPVDPELAERVVGTKLDLPAPGTCRLSTPATVRTRGARGSIELMNVGDLSVRGGTARMPLAVRAFPDVGDLVSGMFYTSEDTASDLPAGATYTLEGTGAGLVDRFAVEVEAPASLEDVRINGGALVDGLIVDEGSPVSVRWRASEGLRTRTSGDVVLVDVSTDSGASVRCAFQDDGHGVLPAWVVGSGAAVGSATLTVHRLRQRAFASPGVDTGEVRFDLGVMGRIVMGHGGQPSAPDRAAPGSAPDRAAPGSAPDRAAPGSAGHETAALLPAGSDGAHAAAQ